MGLVNTNNVLIEGAYNTLDFMSLIEDTSLATNDYASLTQVALEGVAESEGNWNNIMQACYCQELAHFQENGTEYVYTEASGGGFIEAAKAFFKKVWEKIKALFKKFGMMIAQFSKTDKEFVKKYRPDIIAGMANMPKDTEFKGFVFTHIDEFTSKTTEVGNEQATALNSTTNTTAPSESYDRTDEAEKMRGEILGKNSRLTSSEFNSELFEYFRNGESAKSSIDLDSQKINSALNELEASAATKKAANDAYKQLNKYFDLIDKKLNDLLKTVVKGFPKKDEPAGTVDKATDDMVQIQRAIDANRDFSSIAQVAHGIFLTALKDRSRQYKAMCIKVAGYKGKKPKNESYSFDHYGEGASFLEGVVLR